MDDNETPLQRMRIAIDAQGHFGSDGDETLNRQDIQLYALASIAESLARIASTVRVGSIPGLGDVAYLASSSPWE